MPENKHTMKRLSAYFIAFTSLFAMAVQPAYAKDDKDKDGYLTGSFETMTNVYNEDGKTSAVVPDGHFGSNNYLKLDYYKDRLSAGIQVESYSPVLVGYPSDLKGAALTNYFVRWTDDDFSITAGTFYEQFGSGLLFRRPQQFMLYFSVGQKYP